jgi:DNA-3-methyladenine glycosylase
VLLRAAAPVSGIGLMRARRVKARRDRDLCSGPGRLCQAFGLTGEHDGTDLTKGPLRIVDDGTPPPPEPVVTTRVGLRAGQGDESPWRFLVPGDPNISRGPRRTAG